VLPRFGVARAKQDHRASVGVAKDVAKARHRFCRRGRGFLVNRSSGGYYPAPCRSWRDCADCARAYGIALSHRWSKVQGLRAFVVLTMPPELGDWRIEANRRAMMRSWRRLNERLCRRFGRRAKLMHFKEHAGAHGRLHLNVLWDFDYIDQGELSQLAAECGFGPICHISRIGRATVELSKGRAGSSAAIQYAKKTGFRVVAYARKTGSQTAVVGDDWPKRVRRWSASRAASMEMGPRPRNSDWSWSPIEPARDERPATFTYWLLPDDYLPSRQPLPRPPPIQLGLLS